jgi:hypothetical protein
VGREAVLDYRKQALLGGDDAVGGGGDPPERGRPQPRPPRPRWRLRRCSLGRGGHRGRRRGPSHFLGRHSRRRRRRGGDPAHATRARQRSVKFPRCDPARARSARVGAQSGTFQRGFKGTARRGQVRVPPRRAETR